MINSMSTPCQLAGSDVRFKVGVFYRGSDLECVNLEEGLGVAVFCCDSDPALIAGWTDRRVLWARKKCQLHEVHLFVQDVQLDYGGISHPPYRHHPLLEMEKLEYFRLVSLFWYTFSTY